MVLLWTWTHCFPSHSLLTHFIISIISIKYHHQSELFSSCGENLIWQQSQMCLRAKLCGLPPTGINHLSVMPSDHSRDIKHVSWDPEHDPWCFAAGRFVLQVTKNCLTDQLNVAILGFIVEIELVFLKMPQAVHQSCEHEGFHNLSLKKGNHLQALVFTKSFTGPSEDRTGSK